MQLGINVILYSKKYGAYRIGLLIGLRCQLKLHLTENIKNEIIQNHVCLLIIPGDITGHL